MAMTAQNLISTNIGSSGLEGAGNNGFAIVLPGTWEYRTHVPNMVFRLGVFINSPGVERGLMAWVLWKAIWEVKEAISAEKRLLPVQACIIIQITTKKQTILIILLKNITVFSMESNQLSMCVSLNTRSSAVK